MKTLVIGDVHGDIWGLQGLLQSTGAIAADGTRNEGWRIIQLGDLIHGGRSDDPHSDDIGALSLSLDVCDVLLLGNHELPHAYPWADFPRFAGMHPMMSGTSSLLRKASSRMKVATSVEGWLITHAGVASSFASGLPDHAPDAAEFLNRGFAERAASTVRVDLFDAVGRARGGREPVGGIFWLDWEDLCDQADTPWSQIVGHSPVKNHTWRPFPERSPCSRHWCIDVGAALSGKVAGLVKEDGHAHWQSVVYP